MDNSMMMPVLFVGHGSPMNAIEDNPFSRGWREVALGLPAPKAILCVSAHWETRGTQVTAMERPRTIYDFGGFPRALYEAQYPAPGSAWLAEEVRKILPTPVELDHSWGLDHGCWSVLLPMFPEATIPVVQLSLDVAKTPRQHYELGKALAPLRGQGILIVGSGNMVHNLRRVALPKGSSGDFNQPYGFEWAHQANQIFKQHIDSGNHDALIDYPALGPAVQLAISTREHYLPLLYTLALQQPGETISYFNDVAVAGSLTMTSCLIK